VTTERRRPWPPEKIREACLAEAFIPVEDVGEMLGRGKTAANAWANHPDCPCRIDRTSRPHRVYSVDLLAMVERQLEGSPLGSRLTRGGMTEEPVPPRSGSSVLVQNHTPAKGEVRGNHSIRTGGA
jgi:hypothetical protein